MDAFARVWDPTVLEHSLTWEMPDFLEAYTLHDSALMETRLSPSGGIAVLIDWDLHWNQNIPVNFSKLAILFPKPYSLTWSQGSWNDSTLGGATSEIVASTEREGMLSDGSVDIRAFQNYPDEIQSCIFDESLTRTVFQGNNWCRITILHNAQVRFFCFNSEGTFFRIPMDSTGSK